MDHEKSARRCDSNKKKIYIYSGVKSWKNLPSQKVRVFKPQVIVAESKVHRDYGRRINYAISDVYAHSINAVTQTCVTEADLAEQFETRYEQIAERDYTSSLHVHVVEKEKQTCSERKRPRRKREREREGKKEKRKKREKFEGLRGESTNSRFEKYI